MKGRRILSFLLAFALLAGMFSFPVIAASESATEIDFSPHVSQSHPRLYVDDFSKLKERYLADTQSAKWYNALIARADDLVTNVAPGEGMNYDIEALSNAATGRIINSQSVLERFYCLAFAAAAENSSTYASRLWSEIELISKLPSWNPLHWLETAELLHSFAIAYDWCYSLWNNTQKQTMVSSMITLGLNQATLEYAGIPRYYKWVYGMDGTEIGTNWTIVCNTGVLLASLAIYEESQALCNAMLNNAVRSMKAGLNAYSYDGSYRESIMYWNYATRNLAMATSAFENAIGGDFSHLPNIEAPFVYDFASVTGISKTPDFLIYGIGNAGVFNYGDTVDGSFSTSPAIMWIGERFDVPHYISYHINALEDRGYGDENLALDLLWYEGDVGDNASLPNDCLFEDDYAVLRSSWDDTGIYATLKGGTNGRPHQHYDIGTFVVDAMGERFARLPGAGNYKWKEPRYNYYLARPEGSNTIVVNPNATLGQDAKGSSTFETFYSGSDSAYAILDMTDAYDSVITTYADKKTGTSDVVEFTAVTSARRGIKMFSDRSRIIIQDEIKMSQSSDVYWFMHTDAVISITNSGKSAILTKNGKRLYVNLLCDADVTFAEADGLPLSTSPFPDDQRTLAYGKKLVLCAEDVTSLELAVELVPAQTTAPSFTKLYTPLDDWHPESEIVTDGRDVTVYGTQNQDTVVTMAVQSPRGMLCAIDQGLTDADGGFRFDFSLPANCENGTYKVYVDGSLYGTFDITDGQSGELTVNTPLLSSGSLQTGTNIVTQSVSNAGTLSEKVIVYVATEQDGEIISVSAQGSEVAAGDSLSFSLEAYVPNADCKVNVYVWYSDYGKQNHPAAKKYVFDTSGGSYQ